MIYTMARTVDHDRAGAEEFDLLKSIMKVQYEGENGAILYDPIFKDKSCTLHEKKSLYEANRRSK